MLGIQTRLCLSSEQDALLGAFLGTFSTLARTAYQRVETGKLEPDKKAVYAWATGQGLTSHQAKSLVMQVEQWRATDQATLDYRLDTLRLRVDALDQAVAQLDQRLAQASMRSSQFLSPRAVARLQGTRFQKHRSLTNKRAQLAQLEAHAASGRAHRVFGSRRLLAQRHRLEEASSPWTPETWRQVWDAKRQGSVTLVGAANHTGGNQSAQVSLETKRDRLGQDVPTGRATLHLRLTEAQAASRLQAAATAQGKSIDVLSDRMTYKRLTLPVTFSHQQAAQLHQAQALGLPITVSLSRRPMASRKAAKQTFSRAPGRKARSIRKQSTSPSPITSNASPSQSLLPDLGTYLHVAFDLPAANAVASRHQGSLGVDVNSWGLSYAAVNADGNLLKGVDPVTGESFALKGDIVLPLQGKSADQAAHLIRAACVQLCDLAEQYKLALAIEDLDFARKKARLRELPPRYARMLSRLSTAGFADALLSRCRKVGIALHRVAPAWTSVAGFAKYGMSLSLSTDQAGAFAIGRAAVLAKGKAYAPLPTHSAAGKKLSPKFVRELQQRRDSVVLHYTESVRFAKPLPVQHQRMLNGQSGFTWRHVRKALGHRKTWPEVWAKSTRSVAPASVQEANASRLGGGDTPGVCGGPVRALASSRPRRVKVLGKHNTFSASTD